MVINSTDISQVWGEIHGWLSKNYDIGEYHPNDLTSSQEHLTPLLNVLMLRMAGQEYEFIDLLVRDLKKPAKQLVDSCKDLEIGNLLIQGKWEKVCLMVDWVLHENGGFRRSYGDCLENEDFSFLEICASLEEEFPNKPLSTFIRDIPDWAKFHHIPRAKETKTSPESKTKSLHVAALKLAATYKYPLSANSFDSLVKDGLVDSAGKQTIAKFFGSWAEACEQAGIDSGTKPNRAYNRRWSENEMLDYLRVCIREIGKFPSINGYESWARGIPDAPSVLSLKARFGTWQEISLKVHDRVKEIGL